MSSLRRFLDPASPVPTVGGLVIAGLGFVLMLVAWGQLADETAVALQLPYVVSGAVTGLGLIMVGLGLVSVQAKRRDAAVLQAQLDELATAFMQLVPSPPKRRATKS